MTATEHRALDICAAVISDLRFDARVWRETTTLAEAGFSVLLAGCAVDTLATRRRLADKGFLIVEVPLERGAIGLHKVVGRVRTAIRVWRVVISTKARAYHAHNIHTFPACWIAARARRARVVYEAHELYGEVDGPGLAYWVLGRASLFLERLAVRKADVVITTNDSRADVLRRRHGIDEVTILPNVPAIADDQLPSLVRAPANPLMLYQGGIYARIRGFREAIDAVASIPNLGFDIVGFGTPEDIGLVRQWIADAGVQDRVRVLPPRPFDRLIGDAARATVGLVPVKPVNLGTYLGDTNKLFEYLAAGIPVVASDLPEIRKVVTLGNPPVGELYDPQSAGSLTEAIRRVLEDGRLDNRRAEAARIARGRFLWRHYESRLTKVYRDLLPGDDRTRRAQ